MPKCPKCGKEIDYLWNYSAVWEEYKLTIGRDGYEQYEFIDDSAPVDGIDDEYVCPECHEVLFTDEEDAVNFLKGNTKEVMEKCLSGSCTPQPTRR